MGWGWVCCVMFIIFSLILGTKKKGMSLPWQDFTATGAVPNVQNASCPCGYVAAASVKIKR